MAIATKRYFKFTKSFLYYKRRFRNKSLLQIFFKKFHHSKTKRPNNVYKYFQIQFQKLKYFYGHLSYKYLKTTFQILKKKSSSKQNLLKMCLQNLESRLDVSIISFTFCIDYLSLQNVNY